MKTEKCERADSTWDKMLGLFELIVIDWFAENLMRAVAIGLMLFMVLMIPVFFIALFFLIF